MIPRRYAVLTAGVIIGTFMSFIMSGVVTWVNKGGGIGFLGRWMAAWLVAWSIAVPLAIFASGVMPRIMARLIKD
ncbi:MAG: DUF2798 domain-containing protein [Pseudomonadota bacterium]